MAEVFNLRHFFILRNNNRCYLLVYYNYSFTNLRTGEVVPFSPIAFIK